MKELLNENKKLKAENERLSKKCDELEQYQRSNNLEIKGVPPGNDALGILQKIGESVGETIDTSDIDICHWVPDANETPEGVRVLAEFNEALAEDAAGAEDTSTISSLQDEDGTPAAGSSDTSIPKDRGTSRKRKRPSTALQEILELQKKAEERCASLAQQRVAMQQEMLQLQRESNDTQKDILGVLKSYFEGRNKSSVN
ncbi:hypothetical protein HPB50_003292 [Hyalomma asiaticum]|uniref:Uncharacterized protein n=1 Tax=Hyalomma asiaticum TaxID=266040 RepID=A0ACB7TBZ2_HYAAI|nr:hypothetical protein HPB50_003292 [Hyalomma asiaticum]